ncbi:MAG TPA: hypothetical protein VE173_06105, partial [Longimicrobiales bacterium]|nr:hypothetical protein [Longimicrobiales bacterium]
MGARWGLLVGTAVLLAWPGPVEGQRHGLGRYREYQESPPTWWLGVDFLAADPLGDFGKAVDAGYGLDVGFHVPVAAGGGLALKADAGFIIYGYDRTGVCLAPPVGCRIDLDLTTSNNIFFAGVGPELAAPTGQLRPYVDAAVGFSYFFTHSSLAGDDADSFGGTTNFDDLVTHTRLGGGLRARLGRTVLLDLGAQYHRNGVAEYLREGDIVDNPDGSVTLHPRRTEANLLVYRIGVTIGLGGRG